MALRLVSDADFNGHVIRGLFRHAPDIDLVRVQDVGLRTASDQEILEWAAVNDRIVLTHDRETMTAFAVEQIQNGNAMPGLIVMRDEPERIGMMIDVILITACCSDMAEWNGRIDFLRL